MALLEKYVMKDTTQRKWYTTDDVSRPVENQNWDTELCNMCGIRTGWAHISILKSRCSFPLPFFTGPVLSTGVVQWSWCQLHFWLQEGIRANIPRAHDLRTRACGLSLILTKAEAFSSLGSIIKKCLPCLGASFYRIYNIWGLPSSIKWVQKQGQIAHA